MKKFIFAGAIALMMTVASCGTKESETEKTTNDVSTTTNTDSVTDENAEDANCELVDSVSE